MKEKTNESNEDIQKDLTGLPNKDLARVIAEGKKEKETMLKQAAAAKESPSKEFEKRVTLGQQKDQTDYSYLDSGGKDHISKVTTTPMWADK